VNKSPAFQFYVKDFLTDDKVVVMNMEARGVYITLLSFCWNNNGLTNNQEELKEMCGNPVNWEKIWGKVGRCFYVKGEKLFNKRLDKEATKQKDWKEKSSKGGKESAKVRWGDRGNNKGGYKKVKTKMKAKGNSSSSSPSSSSSSIPFPKDKPKDSLCLEKFQDEDIRLTQLLIDKMTKNNPNSSILRCLTPKRQEVWIDECRKLREIDKRTSEQIEQIIIFSQNDSFWKSNILSMPKLREKFDQLWLKAKKSKFSGIKEWLNES